MKRRPLGFLASIAALTAGCTILPKNSTGDAAACSSTIWKRSLLVPGASATANVESGALVLRAKNTSGTVMSVTQSGLTGDFRATFDYELFTPGGTGAFAQTSITDDASGVAATATVGTSPAVGVSAGFQGLGTDFDVKQTGTLNQRGTFVFVRSGGTVTVSATNGTTTATKSGGFSTSTLSVGIEIGSNNGVVAPETSIRITSFSIEGGGGAVRADGFDCNSVAD